MSINHPLASSSSTTLDTDDPLSAHSPPLHTNTESPPSSPSSSLTTESEKKKGKMKASLVLDEDKGVIITEGDVTGSRSSGSGSGTEEVVSPPKLVIGSSLGLEDDSELSDTMQDLDRPKLGGFNQSSNSTTITSGTIHPSPSFNSLASSQRPILPSPPLSTSSNTHNPSSLSPPNSTQHTTASQVGGATSVGAGTGSGSGAVTGGSGMIGRPSWKKGGGRHAVMTIERKRLAALGFEEELQRDFDFWASWGMGVSNIGFLPGTLLGVLTALETGGGSMYSIGWPITGIFMCGLAAVLGEMASTYPVAGAMFTWTFRLCRSCRPLDGLSRYISWIVGSFLLCSHILIQIVICYQLSHLIQGVISLHNSSFVITFWKSMGIGWAVLAFTGVLVSSSIVRSPLLWRCCGGVICVSWLIMNVVLLTTAKEIRPASYVFTSYGNDTGWKSRGYVYFIGWVLTCVATGLEACAHMAEDTKNPARTVPLAMFWSTATSYILGWISICVVLATADTSNMSPRLGQPVGVLSSTLSLPLATLLSILILLSLVFQNVAQLLASSRFIFSLARESALPFSSVFKRISPTTHQPIQAIWAIILIAAPSLLLLGIAVTIVTTMFLEGAAWSVMFAYFFPVAVYLGCDRDALRGDGRVEWTLRGWSKVVAWAVVGFASVFMIVACLPTGYPVTSLTASYAAAFAGGVLFLSTLSWIFYGNARYAGPIKTSTRWTLGAEVELPPSTSFKTTTTPPAGGPAGTSSATHGRTAHVFSSFPTLNSNAGSPGGVGQRRTNGTGGFSEDTGYSMETGYTGTSGGEYSYWESEDEGMSRVGEATGRGRDEESGDWGTRTGSAR